MFTALCVCVCVLFIRTSALPGMCKCFLFEILNVHSFVCVCVRACVLFIRTSALPGMCVWNKCFSFEPPCVCVCVVSLGTVHRLACVFQAACVQPGV